MRERVGVTPKEAGGRRQRTVLCGLPWGGSTAHLSTGRREEHVALGIPVEEELGELLCPP